MADPIFGTPGDDSIDGTGGNDWIQASSGDDILVGGPGRDALWGGPGDDIMIGGDIAPGGDTEGGNDTYHVDSIGDIIIEFPDEGNKDRIMSYISYDMSAAAPDVEVIRLVGYQPGHNAVGNDLDNTLEGNREVNTLEGGNGDDSFVIYDLTDVIFGDAGSNTVMVNFTAFLGMTANWNQIENITLMGDKTIHATGNNNDNTLTGNTARNNLIGLGGNDTYVVGTDTKDKITEVAGGGEDTVIAETTFSLAKIKEVENLTLKMEAGPINGIGNALSNTITGNESSNTLDGLAGADYLLGGEGNDTYIVDNVGDVVDEGIDPMAPGGTIMPGGTADLVRASVSFDLNNVVNDVVENLILTGKKLNINGTGNAVDNTIIGNDGNNTIDGGGAGNDSLDGGKGIDTLIGGIGDDTYIVDVAQDVAIEGTPGGNDIVLANIKARTTFVLSADIESLRLTGKNGSNGTGNDIANTITGNSGGNILNGMDGDDTILGIGGKNTLLGGDGIDSIIGGGGIDIIYGGNGDDATLVGGAGADTIFGNDGNDVLTGGGGKDLLQGGDGDDIYDDVMADDTIIELAGQGIDTVGALISYTLGPHLENLTLIAGIFGIGNVLDNTIAGNGSSNTLLGGGGNDVLFGGTNGDDTLDGGTGDDTMIGGPGNDLYFVDSPNDVVTEDPMEGTLDTIRSTASFDMSTQAPGQVEVLQLLGGANLDAIGNDFDNTILGNAGTNTLTGGLGNDTYGMDLTDVVVENTGEGFDTIRTPFTYTLLTSTPTYEVEGLTLTGTNNVNGTGNDLDNRLEGNAAINTLSGLTGNDTYVLPSLAETQFDVIVDLIGEGEDTIIANFSYILGPTTANYEIENLTLGGTADIHGIGNELNNTMRGNDGNNTLDGATGDDAMLGGKGDDTYVVDSLGDTVTEMAGEGIDLVLSGVDFDLATTLHVENLTLTGAALVALGNALGNIVTGNNNDNTLTGAGGIDTLDGGQGADTMDGGLGNDVFYVDNSLDVVIEAAMEGTADEVFSTASFDMLVQAPGEVEILNLVGGLLNINGAGNNSDNTITGNEGNNTIDGNGGDDTLNGGLGIDTLRGGTGDDVYIVNGPGKTIIDLGGEGTADEVQTNMTYTLDAEVEILTLTGAAHINGTGNGLDNTLYGNTGNNTLDGLVGADTMEGGGGNDTYIVDNAADFIDDSSGTEMILTSVSFDMSTQTSGSVDNITLLGAANLDVVGNGSDNTIIGNSGINTMAGGAGHDTYYVTAGDVVIEAGGEGTLDTIVSMISWAIDAGQEIERLILLDAGGAINATGNELENTLVGNIFVNTLDGGLGDDTYDIGNSATQDVILVDTGGDDTVRVGATYSIASRADLENITLVGTDKSNFNATGNANVNTLRGTAGKNILNGGTGADYLMGGAGDDVYHVDDAGDVIDEANPELPGGGKDIVLATVSYSLDQPDAQSIEDLYLIGPNAFNGTGNNTNNYIKGNNLDNILSGGLGADTLEGFGGNDTYIIESQNDVIKDTGGIDWVFSAMPFYTLLTGFEHLRIISTGPGNGTGNTYANTIIGNDEKNVIDGAGGADTMIGGDDDDIFFVDTANDVVIELAGEGTMDHIKTKVNYTIDDTQYVEVMEHIGKNGNLTGNNHDNTLIGNSGTNTLSGGGGNDTLIGGAGKDVYFGGTGSDRFVVDYFGKAADIIKDFNPLEFDSILYGVDIDPLTQVIEDFVEYKIVGADTHVYLDFDAWGTDFTPKLVAIVEGVLLVNN